MNSVCLDLNVALGYRPTFSGKINLSDTSFPGRFLYIIDQNSLFSSTLSDSRECVGLAVKLAAWAQGQGPSQLVLHVLAHHILPGLAYASTQSHSQDHSSGTRRPGGSSGGRASGAQAGPSSPVSVHRLGEARGGRPGRTPGGSSGHWIRNQFTAWRKQSHVSRSGIN